MKKKFRAIGTLLVSSTSILASSCSLFLGDPKEKPEEPTLKEKEAEILASKPVIKLDDKVNDKENYKNENKLENSNPKENKDTNQNIENESSISTDAEEVQNSDKPTQELKETQNSEISESFETQNSDSNIENNSDLTSNSTPDHQNSKPNGNESKFEETQSTQNPTQTNYDEQTQTQEKLESKDENHSNNNTNTQNTDQSQTQNSSNEENLSEVNQNDTSEVKNSQTNIEVTLTPDQNTQTLETSDLSENHTNIENEISNENDTNNSNQEVTLEDSSTQNNLDNQEQAKVVIPSITLNPAITKTKRELIEEFVFNSLANKYSTAQIQELINSEYFEILYSQLKDLNLENVELDIELSSDYSATNEEKHQSSKQVFSQKYHESFEYFKHKQWVASNNNLYRYILYSLDVEKIHDKFFYLFNKFDNLNVKSFIPNYDLEHEIIRLLNNDSPANTQKLEAYINNGKIYNQPIYKNPSIVKELNDSYGFVSIPAQKLQEFKNLYNDKELYVIDFYLSLVKIHNSKNLDLFINAYLNNDPNVVQKIKESNLSIYKYYRNNIFLQGVKDKEIKEEISKVFFKDSLATNLKILLDENVDYALNNIYFNKHLLVLNDLKSNQTKMFDFTYLNNLKENNYQIYESFMTLAFDELFYLKHLNNFSTYLDIQKESLKTNVKQIKNNFINWFGDNLDEELLDSIINDDNVFDDALEQKDFNFRSSNAYKYVETILGYDIKTIFSKIEKRYLINDLKNILKHFQQRSGMYRQVEKRIEFFIENLEKNNTENVIFQWGVDDNDSISLKPTKYFAKKTFVLKNIDLTTLVSYINFYKKYKWVIVDPQNAIQPIDEQNLELFNQTNKFKNNPQLKEYIDHVEGFHFVRATGDFIPNKELDKYNPEYKNESLAFIQNDDSSFTLENYFNYADSWRKKPASDVNVQYKNPWDKYNEYDELSYIENFSGKYDKPIYKNFETPFEMYDSQAEFEYKENIGTRFIKDNPNKNYFSSSLPIKNLDFKAYEKYNPTVSNDQKDYYGFYQSNIWNELIFEKPQFLSDFSISNQYLYKKTIDRFENYEYRWYYDENNNKKYVYASDYVALDDIYQNTSNYFYRVINDKVNYHKNVKEFNQNNNFSEFFYKWKDEWKKVLEKIIDKNWSVRQKIEAVIFYITTNVYYLDIERSYNYEGYSISTPFSIFTASREIQCMGYTANFSMALSLLDIPVRQIGATVLENDSSKNFESLVADGGHAYNEALVDGEWLVFDLTNADNSERDGTGYESFEFDIKKTFMRRDDKWLTDNYRLDPNSYIATIWKYQNPSGVTYAGLPTTFLKTS
ncbi:transglutaminase domain-containing protein [Mycoplasmopsis ciconiae]|uniref:Transglutaminase domain-containing protein n=1 Tax=Mycoplasmopsis ciconiae TaxID=561067 RepID=A0ABU7ML12_9BACT|nr:transglutaminase domain-containing protein [Mycoplasmopsis ciconiae]